MERKEAQDGLEGMHEPVCEGSGKATPTCRPACSFMAGVTFGTGYETLEQYERQVQEKRSGRLYVGLHVWECFVYPELYVREGCFLGHVVACCFLLITFPLCLLYFSASMAVQCWQDHAYRPGGSFYGAFGPGCWIESIMEYFLGAASPMYSSAEELRQARTDKEPEAYVIVVDDFYDDPDRVRKVALSMPMRCFEKGWFRN